MRFEGTLVQWNGDQGLGFVRPTQGGQNLFVHVSAFPRGGRRPQLNERLSFKVAPGQNGKRQAVAIRRPEAAAGALSLRPERARSREQRNPPTGWFGKLVPLLLVCSMLGTGYWKYDQARQQRVQPLPWRNRQVIKLRLAASRQRPRRLPVRTAATDASIARR